MKNKIMNFGVCRQVLQNLLYKGQIHGFFLTLSKCVSFGVYIVGFGGFGICVQVMVFQVFAKLEVWFRQFK